MAKFKVDKEFLLKNRFWILLGLVPLFFLIGWLVLITSVADARDQARKNYSDRLSGLRGITNIKNNLFIDPLKEKEKTLQAHKNKVWARVWESQADMMTWPSSSRAPLARFSSQYYGDDIPDLERREYAYSGLYFSQLEAFKQAPGALYYQGGWEKVFEPVLKWTTAPTTEECWVAQEDLWVKRELLRTIKAALDAVAQFDDVAIFKVADGANREGFIPKDAVARQVCRTPYLELDLIVEEKKDDKKPEKGPPENKPEGAEKKPLTLVLSPKSKLKNISPDKQPRSLEGLQLRLQQRDAKGVVQATADLNIKKEEPLAWDKAVEIGEAVPLGKLDPKEPIEVIIVSDKADPVPKGFLARQRFRNPNWELELFVEENEKKQTVISPKSKVKNVHVNQRTLSLHGLQLLIKQPGQTSVTLRVQGEPLPWNDSVEVRETVRIDSFNVQRPFEVEQVFEWATSPIKRIDEIRLGYHSHRTADAPLQAKKFAGVPEPAAEPPPVGGERSGLDGERPAAAADVGKTPNGLDRYRYYEVTNQVRRLPLGMVLVVDQAHIQDVLTAFSNSRLRVQPTQVHFQHVRGVTLPPPPGSERDPEKPPRDGERLPPFPRPTGKPGLGGVGAVPRPPGEGTLSKPPFGQPGFGEPAAQAGLDEDPNLVQLSVYGIASLYERYPPRPAGPEGNNPPAVPVRPAP